MTLKPPDSPRGAGVWLHRQVGTDESSREAFFREAADLLPEALSETEEQDLFLLSLVEAMNNAAEHGHAGMPQETIEAGLFLAPGLVLARIEDRGPGFVPGHGPLPGPSLPRGRGLHLIRANTDLHFFNRQANAIVLAKGAESMEQPMQHGTATVSMLPGGVAVVTNFTPAGMETFPAVAELFDLLSKTDASNYFLDAGNLRILTSSSWGTIFAQADRDEVKRIIIFNAGPAVVTTAKQMGIEGRGDSYAKIRILQGTQEAFDLLTRTLADATG